MVPDQALPMILTRKQLAGLAARGEFEIRLAARLRGPAALPDRTIAALQARYAPGRRLWARENFATRRDGDQVKVCYLWSGPGPQHRLVPIDQVEPKYLTARYVTRPAKYMPRWVSRLLLEVTAATVDPHPAGDALVIHAKLCVPSLSEGA